MNLAEKLKRKSEKAVRLASVVDAHPRLSSKDAQEATYYFFTGTTAWYAVEAYLDGHDHESREAASLVVNAVLEYFYGDWRDKLATPDGKTGQDAWNPYCFWYDEVMVSLAFTGALSDWDSMKRIAAYPPEDRLPEAADARGETAWGWALVSFLRNDPRERIEAFLAKAENHKAKRPKFLCPVLRALLDKNATEFETALMEYLAYYRKREFKHIVDKVLSFAGTTLYHLGRKQGFEVTLHPKVADHVIRLNESPAPSAAP